MFFSSSAEERVFEFQRHRIPHLLTIYIVESTRYENEAASLVHCNIIYIYISYERLPLRWHLPCRISIVERQISFVRSNVSVFDLIFIKLIYLIFMFPSVMVIQN